MAKAFDWSQYEEKAPSSSFNWDQYAENVSSQPKESFKSSLAQAIPRIGEDVAHAVMVGINALPGYYEKAKTEIPGAYNLIKNDPMRALSQALAGTAEMGRNVFNTPHDISNYLSERLHLVPEDINKKVQMGRMPEDTQQMINQTFGEAKQPGEALIRGLGRNQDLLLGGAGVASTLKPITKKSIENTILHAHDKLEKQAVKGLDKVSEEVKKRKVPDIKINPKYIDKLKSYFPDTEASKKLMERAKTGNYDALRDLQTDLFKHAKSDLKSSLKADRFQGFEAMEKRDKLNKLISWHLKEMGHEDLSNILNKSRKDYAILKENYYNPNLSKSIIKMVDSDKREIPENLPNLLKKRSEAMNKFKEFHPGLAKKASRYGLQKNITSLLKKTALPGTIGYLGYELGKGK